MAGADEVVHCAASDGWPCVVWPDIVFEVQVPSGTLGAALQNPDAVQVALEVGRLDMVTLLLGFWGLLLGFAALWGFWAVRSAAVRAAERTTPESVSDYLAKHRRDLVQDGLSDPQTVARLQAAILALGLGGASEAEFVDTDATKKETEDDGADG